MLRNVIALVGVVGPMRTLALAAIATTLAAAAVVQRSGAVVVAGTRAAKVPAPTLGISYRTPRGRLAWFDPLTLRELPGRKAPLGGNVGSWAFSADRSVVALSSCGSAGSRAMRFVNARAMRVLGDVTVAPSADCVRSLTWLRPRRLLALVESVDGSSVVVVDPVTRRVLHRVPLPMRPSTTSATVHELVLLLAEHGSSLGPAHVMVVDAEGAARIVTVENILAGSIEEDDEDTYRSRVVEPGLAVDPDGRRAFLVPHEGAVAEVDLATMSVTYHPLEHRSLVMRALDWFVPAAHAKVIEGPMRTARWLGGGSIAVSGVDYSIAQSGLRAAPAGLRLIDTRSWTSRMLEPEASGFVVAHGLVVAQGGRWDEEQNRGFGPGLRAFDLVGAERWRVRAGEYRWMSTAGALGYVYLDGAPRTAQVVDLATGAVVRTLTSERATDWPQLLAEQSSGW